MLRTSAAATVWQHRSLLRELVTRDIQNRYAGSLAGIFWALLHPIAMVAVYAVVFEYIFSVRVPNAVPNQPYVLFVAAALWPWLAFSEALSRSTVAVQSHAALVKKVAFPHELLVYSAVVSSFMIQACGFAVVLLVLRLFGFSVSFWAIPLVAIGMFTLLLMSTAVGLVLAALQVFIRDVEQLLTQVMSVLFYATPILYPMASVPAWMANVMQWNPLVHVLEPIRTALLVPGEPRYGLITLSVALVLLAFYMARRFFLKLSPHFEDMV
jgi:lipopolysaccharide transport system permease protein